MPAEQTPGSGTAGIIGLVAGLSLSLLRFFSQRKKQNLDNEAKLEEIYSKGAQDLIGLYKQEISNMKAEAASVAIRHMEEKDAINKRYDELRSRFEALSKNYETLKSSLEPGD